MAYAFVEDIPASWPLYRRLNDACVDPAPRGLVLHVAGPTDEGVRIIDVWASEQVWLDFQAERLAPAIAALGVPRAWRPTFRDLHPALVVVGNPIAPSAS
jgi:hypothetical protein